VFERSIMNAPTALAPEVPVSHLLTFAIIAVSLLFQAPAAVERRLTSRLVITVPSEEAELVVNGLAIPGVGTSRTFETEPLAPGTHQHTFTVAWEPNTYT